MFGWFDALLAYLILQAAYTVAVYACGYDSGVKATEVRWSEAVGRTREHCARNGCIHA